MTGSGASSEEDCPSSSGTTQRPTAHESYGVESRRARHQLYPKNGIQHADEVYASVSGRLVLVGCYLNPDGSRQDRNLVVFAQLNQ